jgi:Putative prokaryotic signal transducing protein
MATQPKPNSDRDLVRVFDTEQESEAMVVKGLLESAGIDALVTSLDAQQDILPGVGGVVVQVAPDRADEAREMIDAYRNQPTTDDEAAIENEPPTA